jgi:hypothetical protein
MSENTTTIILLAIKEQIDEKLQPYGKELIQKWQDKTNRLHRTLPNDTIYKNDNLDIYKYEEKELNNLIDTGPQCLTRIWQRCPTHNLPPPIQQQLETRLGTWQIIKEPPGLFYRIYPTNVVASLQQIWDGTSGIALISGQHLIIAYGSRHKSLGVKLISLHDPNLIKSASEIIAQLITKTDNLYLYYAKSKHV